MIILVILLLGWYFFVPETWLEPIVAPDPIAQTPEVLIPEGLFQPGPEVRLGPNERVPTTIVGGNTWMTANAKVTDCPELRFGDGSEIGPYIEFYDGAARYGYYQNKDSLNYGVLYSHAAVQSCQLCPAGFRVATKADWEKLFAALGGAADRGKLLRRRYGSPFAAGLGGRIDDYGSVLGGRFEFWWAMDEAVSPGEVAMAWGPELQGNGEVRIRAQDQRIGNYVRCVKE